MCFEYGKPLKKGTVAYAILEDLIHNIENHDNEIGFISWQDNNKLVLKIGHKEQGGELTEE